jgi:AcrR family transcriptional regulator
MPKVSDAYKEQRRSALLDSAMRCFAEKGYEATSIDDIVRHANTSKGAIYNYFKSKEEIFLQILERRIDRMRQRLDDQFRTMHSATDKLLYLIHSYGERDALPDRRDWAKIQLEFELYATRRKELAYISEKSDRFLRSLYEEIVRDGIRQGEFHPDLNLEVATSIFWMLRDGIALHFALNQRDDQNIEAILQGAQDMILQYLKRPHEQTPGRT